MQTGCQAGKWRSRIQVSLKDFDRLMFDVDGLMMDLRQGGTGTGLARWHVRRIFPWLGPTRGQRPLSQRGTAPEERTLT